MRLYAPPRDPSIPAPPLSFSLSLSLSWQASLGIRQLCGTARSRQHLTDAGAVPALLSNCDFWEPEVAKAAGLALGETPRPALPLRA